MNFCKPGSLVCWQHGGAAPQVQRKADERMTLRQLMQGEARPLVEVILDNVHTADAITRDMKLRLLEGEAVTPQDLDRLLDLTRLSQHLAKTALDTGVELKLAEQATTSLQNIGALMADVLLTALNALPSLHPAWRHYVLEIAQHRMLEIGQSEPRYFYDSPAEPVPPPPEPPDAPLFLPALPTPSG